MYFLTNKKIYEMEKKKWNVFVKKNKFLIWIKYKKKC